MIYLTDPLDPGRLPPDPYPWEVEHVGPPAESPVRSVNSKSDPWPMPTDRESWEVTADRLLECGCPYWRGVGQVVSLALANVIAEYHVNLDGVKYLAGIRRPTGSIPSSPWADERLRPLRERFSPSRLWVEDERGSFDAASYAADPYWSPVQTPFSGFDLGQAISAPSRPIVLHSIEWTGR